MKASEMHIFIAFVWFDKLFFHQLEEKNLAANRL